MSPAQEYALQLSDDVLSVYAELETAAAQPDLTEYRDLLTLAQEIGARQDAAAAQTFAERWAR